MIDRKGAWLSLVLVACSCSEGRKPSFEPAPLQETPEARSRASEALAVLTAHRVFAERIGGGALIEGREGRFEVVRSRPSAWRSLEARPLQVSFPRQSHGSVRLQRAGDRATWMEITPVDVGATPGVSIDDTVVYANAAAATDLVYIAEGDRFEDVRVLRSKDAKPEAKWRIRLGAGLAGVRVVGGRIEAFDAAGETRIVSGTTFAIDAKGTRRALVPTVAHVDDVFEVSATLDVSGLVHPIALDPLWSATAGAMSVPRYDHSVFTLPSGDVLVAGTNSGSVTTAELFSASSGTFGAAGAPGTRSQAVLFPLAADKVLFVGGATTTQIYDVPSKSWSTTGPTAKTHEKPYVFKMPSGKILAGGGFIESSAELYDPAAGTWSPTAGVESQVQNNQCTQFPTSGKVLCVGQYPYVHYYLLDPSTMTWTQQDLPIQVRRDFSVIALDSKRALVAGGLDWYNVASDKSWIYDLDANTFTPSGTMTEPRSAQTATKLANGRVLLVGGVDTATDALSTADVYDPTSGTWAFAGAMSVPRTEHAAALLASGSVLIAGGANANAYLSTAEIYSPLPNGSACVGGGTCASGFCVDGVCCDRACNGACEACNVSGKAGTCSGLTAAPHAGRGCAPYATCSAGACAGTCTTDANCVAGNYCVSGACVPKKDISATCSATRECLSGLCVDGRCCNAACNGQCEACDVAGKEGTCWPSTGAPHGARTACSAALSDPICGSQCNGTDRTKCNVAPNTKSCGTDSCKDGSETHASLCDGAGKCGDTAKACGAYLCGTTACKTTCSTSADCGPGYGCKASACEPLDGLGAACSDGTTCKSGLFCTDGLCCGVASCPGGSACVKTSDTTADCRKSNGTTCGAASECASNQCVDGVCCDTACSGQCQACDVKGSVGKCIAVTGAPHGSRPACATDASNVCATLTCNGSDATSCKDFAGKDVSCRKSSCEGGVATVAASCDGAGSCPAATTESCNGYACDPTTLACKHTCSGSADCLSGWSCEKGACIVKTGTCSADETQLVGSDGKTTSCSPYICRDDKCVAECATTTDCAASFICDVGSKTCVPLPTAAAPADSGGCTMSNRTMSNHAAGGGSFGLVMLLVGAVLSRRRARALPLAAGAALAACSPNADVPQPIATQASALVWTQTSLAVFTNGGQIVRLKDGRVMRAGSIASGQGAIAELYDPATGTWKQVASMSTERRDLGLAPLSDGKIIAIGGGYTPTNAALSTSEIYDPATNTWSAGPSLPSGRSMFDLAVLTGGQIVLAPLGDSRVFDPSTKTWIAATGSPASHDHGTVTALANGKALAVGGFPPSGQVDLYDPATHAWTTVAPLNNARYNHAAVLLADGRVMVSGGSQFATYGSILLSSVELYDPAKNTWTQLPTAPLPIKRSFHSAALLPSGKVLVAGGYFGAYKMPNADVFDPVSLTWASAGKMPSVTGQTESAVLPSGAVMVSGEIGADVYGPLALGATCALGGECVSGSCVDGVCCSTASCASGSACNLAKTPGTCAKSQGTACTNASECGSGNCVDGVCCESACAGQCEACNVASSLGKCVAVTGPTRGTRAPCDDGAGDPCKKKTCDGVTRASCTYPASGTVSCSKNSCKDGVETHAGTCNGAGACSDTPSSCGAYACGASACDSSCSTAADCVPGYACLSSVCTPPAGLGKACTATGACEAGLFCVEGVCCGSSSCESGSTCAAPGHAGVCTKNNAQKCSVDAQCASGFCTDGVCCDARCAGQCAACDVAGLVGSCSPVKGTPHGGRAACDTGSGDACAAKVCNGSDTSSCAGFVGAEVACRVASCGEGKAVAVATCDGMGMCPAPETTACGGFSCDGAVCRTSCTTDDQCAYGYVCNGGTCKPRTAICADDGATVSLADGSTKRCYPFRCAAGDCLTQCTTSTDCADGFICDSTTKACVPPDVTAAPASGGCTVSAPTQSAAWPALSVLALMALRRRRRAR